MNAPRLASLLALSGALLALATPAARAVVLDWDTLTWTSGALSQSYDIDPAYTGDDITFSIGGTTGELASDRVNGLPTPQVNTNLAGGLSPVQNGLNIALDLGKKDRFITITISFSALYTNGVSNVSFSLFNIDQAPGSNLYIDEIRSISALLADGSTVAPTITDRGSAVSLSGSGLSQQLTGNANVAYTGAGSGNGNATLNFSFDGIRSITFTYGAGGNAATNPSFQEITISDLSYSPVPELNPALLAAALCAGLAALQWRRMRRAKLRTA